MLSWFRKRGTHQTGWSANAYIAEDIIVLHSCSRTYNNRGWYNQPVFALSVESEAFNIGETLRAAINSSIWDSRIDDSQQSPHPVVEKAGFDSWRSLEKNSRLVITNSDRKTISIIPTRRLNGNAGRGFAGLDDQLLLLEWDCDDVELGRALQSAFEFSH